MNQNALASPTEIQSLTNYFLNYFDQDHDGLLKDQEVFNMLSLIYRQPYQDKAIGAFYDVWDTNKDGKVDRADIEALCRKYLSGEENFFQVKTEKAKKKVYTKEALKNLEVARRLFNMFDNDKSGVLGLNEVMSLMKESSKIMGAEFNGTLEDAKSFMEMIDVSGKGNLLLEDYENYVLKSLKESGINVENEQMKL